MPEIQDVQQWHDKTLQQHEALRDAAAQQDFRFQSLALYGTAAKPLYAAVMIKWSPFPAQHDFPLLTLASLQSTIADQKAAGYGPVIITATGPAGDPRFAVVFEKLVAGEVHQLTMTSGSSKDPTTLQGQMAAQKAAGLILRWAASYGDSSVPRFAAIWHPQTSDKYLWNADGAIESGTTYQQRFDAQTSVKARPYFVTLNKSRQYLSAFVANEVGGWAAQHGLDAAGLTSAYTTYATTKKWVPVCIQAAGDDAASAGFTAIFTQGQAATARTFTATGPVANAQIDAVIQQAMHDSPVRHATLAIVHKKQLVYARAYTHAEPGWPIAQPTTYFRLASNSKTVTALAAYQMIERGQLSLDDKLQTLLQLKTPTGAAPPDSRFATITLRHLIEHTSGLDTDGFRNGVAVRDAFTTAGHTASLPVSLAQTASYIASLPLVSTPDDAQVYNNCGYHLIGRMICKKRNVSDLISGCAQLFSALGITRIRHAVSLIGAQPADEARYQTLPLSVGASQMADARPLVSDEYGTEQIEALDGAGGLSAAAPDMARLIAMVLSDTDTAAMKRTTIVEMMNNAVACAARFHHRAGYGWDGAHAVGTDQFYAQKGGSLDTNHSVTQLNGDWGFFLAWAGDATAATSWYPDYPDVMNLAKATAWSATDLFPQFGMPSL